MYIGWTLSKYYYALIIFIWRSDQFIVQTFFLYMMNKKKFYKKKKKKIICHTSLSHWLFIKKCEEKKTSHILKGIHILLCQQNVVNYIKSHTYYFIENRSRMKWLSKISCVCALLLYVSKEEQNVSINHIFFSKWISHSIKLHVNDCHE